ncbi:MAG: zinc ribbon domain-containing protein [Clostridia bacterium]|nr:zinc ribbon domain-containing protein [Clostridia bacterium]
MKCPNCNTPLNKKAKFCSFCGHPVPAEAPEEKITRVCSSCHQPLSENAKLCNRCGTPRQKNPQTASAYITALSHGISFPVNSLLRSTSVPCRNIAASKVSISHPEHARYSLSTALTLPRWIAANILSADL